MLTITAGTKAANDEKVCAWLRDHDIDPYFTYQVEIDLDTGETMTVYQYDRDEQGQKFVHPGTNEPARREPFTVPLKAPPPPIASVDISTYASGPDKLRVAV